MQAIQNKIPSISGLATNSALTAVKTKIPDVSSLVKKTDIETELKDGAQNYLLFQPMLRYFKRIAGGGSGNYIYFCKSKGFSDARLDSITASSH